jgi:hypothetical protein
MTVLIDLAKAHCSNHSQHLGPVLLVEKRRVHMKIYLEEAAQEVEHNLPLAHD